ncbi:MAG: SDR family oxidoreductase [Dehalococcoidia bacterium]
MRALITGGSRGIGKAIAFELGRAGHELLLVARNRETLERTAGELRTACRGKIAHFVCDVAKAEDQDALRKFCTTSGFVPEILVLNAGIFIEGSLSGGAIDELRETLDVNFFSIHRTVTMFIDDLKTQHGSKIILMGSTAAYEPYPIGPLYGVAKWALRGYAINLRRELMNDGVGVTFLSPGGTLTDLWEGETLPENRLLQPEDIAKLVAAILTLSEQAVVEELIVRPMLGDMHE